MPTSWMPASWMPAAWRPTAWRRRLAVAAMLGLVFIGGAGLVLESYRAAVFWWIDPWPAEAPVLWTPTSGHVQQLRAAVSRLDECVAPDERIAVGADPRLGAAGLHWFLWLAYSMPGYDLQLLGTPSERIDGLVLEPEVLLLAGDRMVDGWDVTCSAHPIRVLRRGGETTKG